MNIIPSYENLKSYFSDQIYVKHLLYWFSISLS